MTRLILAAMCAALLSSCVVLEKREGFTNTVVTFPFLAPPAHYDRPAKDMAVMRDTPRQVHNLCRYVLKRRVRSRILGCAVQIQSGCIIVIPHGEPIGGAIYRHERAHCNGWGHP